MKPPVASAARPRLAAAILTALLLLLAFRLTASETLRESLAQKMANVTLAAMPPGPNTPGPTPIIGPPFTAWYAVMVCAFAGAAVWLAGKTLRRALLGELGLILLILLLAVGSTYHAADRFDALVGTLDLATALLAAWTLLVLCQRNLLGDRGRQIVIAAVIAILMVGTAKALMQEFVEFPDTLQMVDKDPDGALRAAGIDPSDPAQRTLFLNRLKSAEVSGFGALSNVFATQMIPCVVLLAGLLVAGIRWRAACEPGATDAQKMERTRRRAGRPGRAAPAGGGTEISLYAIACVGLGMLLLAALAVLPMTESKGGIAAAVVAVAAVVLGGIWHRWVAGHRRALLGTAGLAAALLVAAVLGYGMTHHGLPTRSLLFRWQYWTGAMPIIRAHPWWGVGLNNFGDYYAQFKLPASPEDVRDPHNFFVRLASEVGLPALVAVGGLLFVMVRRGLAGPSAPIRDAPDAAARAPSLVTTIACAAAVAGLGWVPLHFFVEAPNTYTVIIDFLMAALGWSSFAAAMTVMDALDLRAMRYFAVAGVIAALAMLLYDQVNMALVTGPVAMLFWMLLAVGDGGREHIAASEEGVPRAMAPWRRPILAASVIVLFAGALAVASLIALPLGSGDFGPDPAPFEYAYIHQMGAANFSAAADALDAALRRSPNSIELLLQRISLNRQILHRPMAADIRRVLQLDRSNAGVRLTVALPESDLPADERRRALEEALAFDQALAPDEAKRLNAEQLAAVQSTLARLQVR